ncbi:hypothetical protein [Gulosibacter faecalis]|jgi:hypothetical protein|uniref:Antitoxin n=1 Tax=Gulosibacter faecalis TaxID=272240 RepID=A0ABW5UXK3_9MICO|nr:hypothetical protein [Gulosibacter faecalis]
MGFLDDAKENVGNFVNDAKEKAGDFIEDIKDGKLGNDDEPRGDTAAK